LGCVRVFFRVYPSHHRSSFTPKPFHPSRQKSKCHDGNCNGDFKFFVLINPVWSRLLSACLVVVAALALILFFQLRRKSGLLTDPRGIAGIASMATKSHILTDFQGMDMRVMIKFIKNSATVVISCTSPPSGKVNI